jgi:hypothetical protein
VCTAGIQMVFLSYVIFRGASNVRGVQTIGCMSGIREDVACRSSAVEMRGWDLRWVRPFQLRLLGEIVSKPIDLYNSKVACSE